MLDGILSGKIYRQCVYCLDVNQFLSQMVSGNDNI